MVSIPAQARRTLGLRLLVAIVGGYVLSAAMVAVLGGVLPALGLTRSDAVALASMLGPVFYLVLLLWAFSVCSMGRLYGVVGGGLAVAFAMLWQMPIGV
ncbi:hypothetical protein [Candidatus Nitrotoga arctica]|uniref:Iron transporter n=1 Tax=Candidatus Nitrotoga arctica TaxID=453162 RepID=A0ABM8Z296_9PROT|nr:hypothetical protein [Candidatus Nitrotoga arctica]CAG9933952.1 conserved membrane protein of unknown function [Candidatus Nitrotoga arctica]